jgi:hypothetical protein
MAQRPDLPLKQYSNIAKIDNMVGKSNPIISSTEIIRSVQYQLPRLYDEDARFQQTKYIQRSLLRWKNASGYRS